MIIVTGARGFLGRYVMKELENGGLYPVAIEDFSRNFYGKYKFDIRQKEHFKDLPREEVQAVVHCAALLMINGHDPEEYFQTNSLGTYNVLEYCREVGAKMIYTMTHSDVNASGDILVTERTPRCFTTNSYGRNSIPFIASKIAAAEMVEAYNRSPDFEGIIFRIASMRGYGSADTKFDSPFHQFIRKARKGEDIELWGKRRTIRDLVYVKDVARAVRMVINTSNIKGLYNIGSGRGLTIEGEVKAIIDVFSEPGARSKVIYREDIDELRKHSCIFDISKARNDFLWFPITTYESALYDMKLEMEEVENGG